MNDLFHRLKSDFRDKDYRHIYTNGFIDSKIATQIKVLREQRDWTQDVLADETGMRQARISLLEDVNYSSWSLSTLRRFARAFDLYVDVEFKEFGTLGRQLEELDRDHLSRRSFLNDPVFHAEQAMAMVPVPNAEIVGQKISGSDSVQNKMRPHLVPIEHPNGQAFVQALSQPKQPSNVIPWPIAPQRRPKEYAAIGGNPC